MNVQPAWKEGVTGKGVVVTILDDGLEKDHPDLVRNYVSRKVYYGNLITYSFCYFGGHFLFTNWYISIFFYTCGIFISLLLLNLCRKYEK